MKLQFWICQLNRIWLVESTVDYIWRTWPMRRERCSWILKHWVGIRFFASKFSQPPNSENPKISEFQNFWIPKFLNSKISEFQNFWIPKFLKIEEWLNILFIFIFMYIYFYFYLFSFLFIVFYPIYFFFLWIVSKCAVCYKYVKFIDPF